MRRGLAASTATVLVLCACASVPLIGRRAPDFWGILVSTDTSSVASANAHSSLLDAVISGFIPLDSLTGMPASSYQGPHSSERTIGTKRLAIVTVETGTTHSTTIRRLASDAASLARSSEAIAERASSDGYGGLVLAFDGLEPLDGRALVAVASAIRTAARKWKIEPVAVAVPAGDTAAYPGALLVDAADMLFVRLTNQHWLTSPPGPPASPDWVRRMLAARIAEVGPSRIVAVLPVHGLVWPEGEVAVPISFTDAQRLAAEGGIALVREPSSATLHAMRPGQWEMWVSDAVLLDTLVSEASRAGVRRFALWRLGLEDPLIWSEVVGRR